MFCPVLKSHLVSSLRAHKLGGCAVSVALADEGKPSQALQSQSPSDRHGSIAGCY